MRVAQEDSESSSVGWLEQLSGMIIVAQGDGESNSVGW